MTDRELLELAAKAACIDTSHWTDDNGGGFWIYPGVGCRKWNPLEDDGDALRLAVKLKIEPKFYGDDSVETQTSVDGWEQSWAWEDSKDLCAATRRAIVRAAAAIGEDS